ncbi:MAG: hypothetical protein RIT45_2860 [Pseudomonadota bacterium]|jgi:predicted N-formylglutamate amidohydrolase
MTLGLVLSCEHAGQGVPATLEAAFSSEFMQALLASHRGWDAGAAAVGEALGASFGVPLLRFDVSRLVVDANRSVGHRSLHHAAVPPPLRDTLVRTLHAPHRAAVERTCADVIADRGAVVHVAVHSFTPTLAGRARPMEIGLLYDPGRPSEAALCRRWQRALRRAGVVTTRNLPYRGWTDGLCTHLRRRWPDAAYRGVELECRADVVQSRGAAALATLLAQTLREAIDGEANP